MQLLIALVGLSLVFVIAAALSTRGSGRPHERHLAGGGDVIIGLDGTSDSSCDAGGGDCGGGGDGGGGGSD